MIDPAPSAGQNQQIGQIAGMRLQHGVRSHGDLMGADDPDPVHADQSDFRSGAAQ